MDARLQEFRKKHADLLALKRPDQKLYFIGGVVRDLFLQREHKDIDILVDGDTREIARKLASRLNGAFFMLDEKRNTSRVVINQPHNHQIYDFAAMQGQSIEEDLALRDFTINAMAIDFDHPEEVIDPLNGRRDLHEKVLRVCSETSFSRDPIRVIRAIRYSITCGVKIEPNTLAALKTALPGLANISSERKRDELFKILETEKPALGMTLLSRLGIMQSLAGETGEINFAELAALKQFFLLIEGKKGENANRDFFETSFNLRLGRFYSRLTDYFNSRNSSDRTEQQLALAAVWLRQLPIESREGFAQSLALSKEEHNRIQLLFAEEQRVEKLISLGEMDARSIYLFYQGIQEAGLDLVLMALAKKISLPASELSQEKWLASLEKSETLISAWFEKPEVVRPKMLLNGNDLMLEFDLTPGPSIGVLLEKLREEQAAGLINSRREALTWVEAQLGHATQAE